MKKYRTTRLIYDKTFYTLQAILHSEKFARLKEEFHSKLIQKGTPIPQEGFKTIKDYYMWREIADKKLSRHYTLMQEMLEQFGITYTDEYRLGLAWYLLFGHKKAPLVSPYSIGTDMAEDKKSVQVRLTVYPWTKKADLEDIWDSIHGAIKQLPNYRKRNREWKTFERDFKVYQLFLKVHKDMENGVRIDKREKSRSAYITITYYPEFEQIKADYKSEKLDDFIRSIVSRCRKTFGNAKFV